LAADIREVVKRRAKGMARDFEAYAPLLPLPNVLVLKYEDMIFRKADLIRHLARHFGMVASEQMVADILGWADKTPEEEDPRNFVRQVSPGDHRRKLDRETITHLNQMLAHAMAQFGYAP
jgi:hypothetical protein